MITGMDIFIGCRYGSETGTGVSTLNLWTTVTTPWGVGWTLFMYGDHFWTQNGDSPTHPSRIVWDGKQLVQVDPFSRYDHPIHATRGRTAEQGDTWQPSANDAEEA
jgi:hypothetical protein